VKIKWWPRGLLRCVCIRTVVCKKRRSTKIELGVSQDFSKTYLIGVNIGQLSTMNTNFVSNNMKRLDARQLTSTFLPVVFSWIKFTSFLMLVLCLYRPTFLYNDVLFCKVWNLVITSYLGCVVKCIAPSTCWGIYKTKPIRR
jgi:hypothetical protein